MHVEHISEGADAGWKTVVGLSPREAWGYIPAFTAYDFFFPLNFLLVLVILA